MTAIVNAGTTAFQIKEKVQEAWGIAVDWQVLTADDHETTLDDPCTMVQNEVNDGDTVFLCLFHAEHGAATAEDSRRIQSNRLLEH